MYVRSCLLFHGPGAEETAIKDAKAHGRLVPFESGGLKKDGARELVGLIARGLPGGDATGSVLVGPVDEITPETSDVLLKTIEDFSPRGVRPFLWAWDLGGVSLTLRSRCISKFCPGVDTRVEEHVSTARSVLKSYMAGDWVTLIEALKEHQDLPILLRAVVEELTPGMVTLNPDPRHTTLWEVLRDLFGPAPLTSARVVGGFLQADHRANQCL